jgi:phage baseplate assembly protein W
MKSLSITYPIKESEENFLFMTDKTSGKAYSSDLLLLMTTEIGERWYYPEYGWNYKKYLFEENIEINHSNIETDIQATVARFIPDLTISKVNIYNDEANQNIIYLELHYTYESSGYEKNDAISIRFLKD